MFINRQLFLCRTTKRISLCYKLVNNRAFINKKVHKMDEMITRTESHNNFISSYFFFNPIQIEGCSYFIESSLLSDIHIPPRI